ncbi:MAG: barstar family protein [Caulobacteraceae bacterium]
MHKALDGLGAMKFPATRVPLADILWIINGPRMEITLDGRDWQTEADFIEAVLAGVDAPDWHGRNYNGLRDSFVTGDINGVDPPYDFVIKVPAQPTPELLDGISYFVERIAEWRAEGAQLSVRLV